MIDETRIQVRPPDRDEITYVAPAKVVRQSFGVTFEWDENLNLVAVTIPGDINDFEVQRITRS